MPLIIVAPPLLRKPSKDFSLDRRNPLARKVRNMWLMNEGGGTRVRDVIGNCDGTLAGSDVTWQAQPNRGFVLNSAGTASTTSGLTIANMPTVTASWSWDARIFYRASGDSFQTLFTQGNTKGIWLAGVSQFDFYNAGDHLSASSLASDVWTHLLFAVDATGTGRLYINGKQDANTFATGGSFTPTKMFNDSSSETFEGRIEYERFWNVELKAGDAAALARNPYQIFKPAAPRIWVVGGAAAVTQFPRSRRQETIPFTRTTTGHFGAF